MFNEYQTPPHPDPLERCDILIVQISVFFIEFSTKIVDRHLIKICMIPTLNWGVGEMEWDIYVLWFTRFSKYPFVGGYTFNEFALFAFGRQHMQFSEVLLHPTSLSEKIAKMTFVRARVRLFVRTSVYSKYFVRNYSQRLWCQILCNRNFASFLAWNGQLYTL